MENYQEDTEYTARALCKLKCKIQQAQLSQRDRATLRDIEYFAKSLKITQGQSK